MNNKWTYNFGDSEIWSNDEEYDTKEEAIQAAIEYIKPECESGDSISFFVGQMEDYIPSIDVSYLLDSLSDDASSECGEVAHDWPNYTNAEFDILNSRIYEVVTSWLKEIGEDNSFYKVKNIETILTEIS